MPPTDRPALGRPSHGSPRAADDLAHGGASCYGVAGLVVNRARGGAGAPRTRTAVLATWPSAAPGAIEATQSPGEPPLEPPPPRRRGPTPTLSTSRASPVVSMAGRGRPNADALAPTGPTPTCHRAPATRRETGRDDLQRRGRLERAQLRGTAGGGLTGCPRQLVNRGRRHAAHRGGFRRPSHVRATASTATCSSASS